MICTNHDYCFVTTPKCGSRSIIAALQNSANGIHVMPQSNGAVLGIGDDLVEAFDKGWVWPNMAERWRSHVGEEVWARMFTFTMVRNPYDRAVSMWRYTCKIRRPMSYIYEQTPIRSDTSFEDFCRIVWVEKQISNIHYVPMAAVNCDRHGDIVVGEVYKMENYDGALKHLGQKLGVSLPSYRLNTTSHRGWRSYYKGGDAASIVEEAFRDDFEIFGYGGL